MKLNDSQADLGLMEAAKTNDTDRIAQALADDMERVFGSALRDNPEFAVRLFVRVFGEPCMRHVFNEGRALMEARQRAAKIMKEHKEP
jgi:hypothetical protein